MAGIFDFFTFIGILSSGHAFLLGNTLLWRKSVNKEQFWVTGLLLILCFNVAHDTLIQSQLLRHFPHFLYTGELFNYLIWPFVFFYIQGKKPGDLKVYDCLHFLPFIVFNLNRWDLYLSNALEKKNVISGFYETYSTQSVSMRDIPAFEQILEDLILWRIQGLVYIGLIIWLLVQRKKVQQLAYITFMACASLWLIQYIFHWLPYLYPTSLDANNKAEIVSRAVLILAFAHLYFRQPQKPVAAKAYTGSQLSKKDEARLAEALTKLFEKERPYLQRDLSLSSLAAMLDTNTRYLSQVIHTRHGKSYTDFVNTYRITEVKSRLQDKQYTHLTLDAIAQDAGFNSVATCQRSFKKLDGYSPSHYRL